nr:MAG TPA: hypothetical protein [Caudoviricetes sp.]
MGLYPNIFVNSRQIIFASAYIKIKPIFIIL